MNEQSVNRIASSSKQKCDQATAPAPAVVSRQRQRIAAPRNAIPPRERILAVAAHLFADHGLHGVTIRDIASMASVQLSALYRFFVSKEAIYLAACGEVFGSVGRKYLKELPQTDRPIEDIYRFVVELYGDLTGDHRLRKLLVRETMFGEGSIIDILIANDFLPHFSKIVQLCGQIFPGEQITTRTFEIYVFAVGYTQMATLGRTGKIMGIPWDDSRAMACRILAAAFPEQNWDIVMRQTDK